MEKTGDDRTTAIASLSRRAFRPLSTGPGLSHSIANTMSFQLMLERQPRVWTEKVSRQADLIGSGRHHYQRRNAEVNIYAVVR